MDGMLILCTATVLQGNVCKIKQGIFLKNEDKSEESTVFCGVTSCGRNTPTFLGSVFVFILSISARLEVLPKRREMFTRTFDVAFQKTIFSSKI
jgi:hypothetical protein